MKIYLPSKFNKVVKILVIILVFFFVEPNFNIKEISTPDLNINKNVSLRKYYIDYGTEIIKDPNHSFLEEYIKVEGEKGIKISADTEEEAVFVKEPTNEVIAIGAAESETFTGEVTAYGPDCKNCSGMVRCKPYQDVRNGNIYYNDDADYKNLRIVAADSSMPCGTIVKISGLVKGKDIIEEPIIAIVLDRGSAIKGNILDLLFESEEEAFPIGRQSVKIDVLRWGASKK